MCLAGPLEKAGYTVKIIDQRLDREWKDSLKKEISSQTLCIGISAMTGRQIRGGIEAAKLIRKLSPERPIVWGGIHPSLLPEQTIRNKFVDIIVIGEGEKTLLDLVKALENKRPLNEVKGIYYKSDGQIFSTPSQELLDLDRLSPLPYHLVDIHNYRTSIKLGNSNLMYYTSRGCPHSCRFCYNQSFNQRKWRHKSPEKLIEELKTIKGYGVSAVSLADDDFFAERNRIKNLSAILKKEIPGLKLKTSCRIDYVLRFDDDYLRMLKDSGFSTFYIGIESGSDRILDMLNKGITVKDILSANRKLRKAKISSYYSFMAGFPTEDLEDMQKTLNLMLCLSNENEYAHILPIKAYTPYPGTDLYNICLEYGFKQPNTLYEWGDFEWNVSHATWLNKKVRDFVTKISYLTLFLNGKNLFELRKIKYNRLLKGILNIYAKIAQYRIKKNFYRLCPEIKLMKLIKKSL